MMPAQGQNKPHNRFVELLLFSLTVQLKKKKNEKGKICKNSHKYSKELQKYFEQKRKNISV